MLNLVRVKVLLFFTVTIFAISGCNSEPKSAQVPKFEVRAPAWGDFRYRANERVALDAKGNAYWVQQLVRGFEYATSAQQPASISKVKSYKKCVFPKPLETEKFSHVHLDLDRNATNLHSLSDTFLRARAAEMVTIAATAASRKDELLKLSPENRLRPPQHNQLQFKIADIIITDTSKPHYLALASNTKTIFNIVVGPGVKIAKIVIVGSEEVGYANVPAGVPVAVLSGDQAKSCGAIPVMQHFRQANRWMQLKNNDHKDLNQLYSKAQKHRKKFAKWFEDAFSQSADIGITGTEDLAHVIIGPVPSTLEARIPYRPLKGSNIRIVSDSDVFFASSDEYRRRFSEMLMARYEALRGSVGKL